MSWAVVTVGWVWLAVRDGGSAGLVRQLPAIVLAATVVYAVLVRPAVMVDGDGVRLRNVLRDVDVPWAALERVSTRFALTLHTLDGQQVRAWAAPASGRHVDARLTAGDVRALGWDDDEPLTASASTASPSGVAAAWVRREWRRALADAGDGGPGTPPAGSSAPSAGSGTTPAARAGAGGGVVHRTARGPVLWLVGSAALTVVALLA
ncbi:hypothetical protein CAE01nite_24250 [Cellulomonas aerilata]|uniref:Low molecular weight protein antigen 6 PH domain-containing protein n=1 Tax=Cellulomonas aerilata TaxID=515326 RepID=A0A512DEN8_9CELL|nr:hypothetical protein CAE01nite_24250 [Cellulomonas aerilata]